MSGFAARVVELQKQYGLDNPLHAVAFIASIARQIKPKYRFDQSGEGDIPCESLKHSR